MSLGFNELLLPEGCDICRRWDMLMFHANKPVCILVGSCSDEGQNLQLRAALSWKRKSCVSHVPVSFGLMRNCKQATRCNKCLVHLQYWCRSRKNRKEITSGDVKCCLGDRETTSELDAQPFLDLHR